MFYKGIRTGMERRISKEEKLLSSIHKVFVTYVSFPNFPFSWMHFGSGGQSGNETVDVETEMTSFKLNYTRFCRFSTFFGLIRRMRCDKDEMEWNFAILEEISALSLAGALKVVWVGKALTREPY